jgi:hypothetical protein
MESYFDLGSHCRPITTSSEEAQLWFNRGLNWLYGFNHAESVACFQRAAEFDPACAMVGTQRQIMLAVRLALSQEFITTLERHQFIFLDEPFAFFDQERTRAALHALPELSHELRQIWIVAQEFPEQFPFDAYLRCEKEFDRLTWSPGSTSNP